VINRRTFTMVSRPCNPRETTRDVGVGGVGGASRGEYVQDERYIAKSTRMCGAIVSVLQNITIERRDFSVFTQIFKLAARRASHNLFSHSLYTNVSNPRELHQTGYRI
jgi:hypothetical protein